MAWGVGNPSWQTHLGAYSYDITISCVCKGGNTFLILRLNPIMKGVHDLKSGFKFCILGSTIFIRRLSSMQWNFRILLARNSSSSFDKLVIFGQSGFVDRCL